MKNAFRLHIGLMVAKALYSSRDAHLADFERLQSGVDADGVALTLKDKLLIVDAMMTRVGKDTAGLWVPGAVLMGLEKMWEDHKTKHAQAKAEASEA